MNLRECPLNSGRTGKRVLVSPEGGTSTYDRPRGKCAWMRRGLVAFADLESESRKRDAYTNGNGGWGYARRELAWHCQVGRQEPRNRRFAHGGLVTFSDLITWWSVSIVCSIVRIYARKHGGNCLEEGQKAWRDETGAVPGIGTKPCRRSRKAGEEAVAEDLQNKCGSNVRQ